MTLENRVACCISNIIEVQPHLVEAELRDAWIDDFDRILIAMELEDEFNIEISDDIAYQWQTFSDIVEAVRART